MSTNIQIAHSINKAVNGPDSLGCAGLLIIKPKDLQKFYLRGYQNIL